MEQIYTCETWLHGAHGENVRLANEERTAPFPLYQIGTKVTTTGGSKPKSYTVRRNYVGDIDPDGNPLRQTLVVD
jgi:hypothetical protein